jgi:hypothetical protein
MAYRKTSSCGWMLHKDILRYFSVFSKDYGILTKAIRLEGAEIVKDSSQCMMSSGSVRTGTISNLAEFKDTLARLGENEAIALGGAEGAGSTSIRVVTKALEAETEGAISRSKEHIQFKAGADALMLLDYDPERDKASLSIEESYAVLLEIMPELVGCEVWL